MRCQTILLIILTVLLTGIACRKDKDNTPDCQQLRTSITTNDRSAVKEIITTVINRLHARKHTRDNLAKLVTAINQQCQVNASLVCFSCIYTLPPQSEISVSVAGTTGPIKVIVDISYDKNDYMIVAGVHE